MESLPKNPAGLTEADLEATRVALMAIINNKRADAFDRIRAAKEIRGWTNDIWKWKTGNKPIEDDQVEAPAKPMDPLAGLKVVG